MRRARPPSRRRPRLLRADPFSRFVPDTGGALLDTPGLRRFASSAAESGVTPAAAARRPGARRGRVLAPALRLTGLLRSRASAAALGGRRHLALRERSLARCALLTVLALQRLGRLLELRARAAAAAAAAAARRLAALVQLQQVVGVAKDVVHLLRRGQSTLSYPILTPFQP